MIYKLKRNYFMLKHTTFNSVFALKQAHLSGGLLHCLCVSHRFIYCTFLSVTPLAAAKRALDKPFFTSFPEGCSCIPFFTGFFRYVCQSVDRRKSRDVLLKECLQPSDIACS